MTKRSKQERAQPDDTTVELASPPCLIGEVDPAYMGLEATGDPPAASRPGKRAAAKRNGRRRAREVS